MYISQLLDLEWASQKQKTVLRAGKKDVKNPKIFRWMGKKQRIRNMYTSQELNMNWASYMQKTVLRADEKDVKNAENNQRRAKMHVQLHYNNQVVHLHAFHRYLISTWRFIWASMTSISITSLVEVLTGMHRYLLRRACTFTIRPFFTFTYPFYSNT